MVFRKAAFISKGLWSFTKGGYQRAEKAFEPMCEVKGRSFVVTGANSGIGKAIATELARLGGTVHMVCRSKERGEAAVDEIVATTGNKDVHLVIGDLAEPDMLFATVDKWIAEKIPIDVLVNNAGCMVHNANPVQDGIEYNFGVNTLGTYLLTTRLAPYLATREDTRVITVSSGGMYLERLDAADPQLTKRFKEKVDAQEAYAQHKRQQVVMMEEMAAGDFGSEDVSRAVAAGTLPLCFSMHPGWADTPALETAMPGFHSSMQSRLRTPEEGADCAVWLATAPRNRLESGAFYLDRKPQNKHLCLAGTAVPREEQRAFLRGLAAFLPSPPHE